jgi:hypothetical protein
VLRSQLAASGKDPSLLDVAAFAKADKKALGVVNEKRFEKILSDPKRLGELVITPATNATTLYYNYY